MYCGCGGLSFVGSNEFQTPGARVEVAYAVDAWSDAIATFKLNHPKTKVTRSVCVKDETSSCSCTLSPVYSDVCLELIEH